LPPACSHRRAAQANFSKVLTKKIEQVSDFFYLPE